MRIVRLQVEGFKRLIAVDITPDGDLVEVRGNNGNGKSSVLDAIFCAVGGAGVAPVMPVREGEEMAIIRVDLGELVVTRIFTEDGTTRLKVTNADGSATFSSGQAMLDALVGHIAFDPLEFARLKPDEQAEQLRRLVDIPVDLDALARERTIAFNSRRDTNRDVKALKARLDSIPKVDKPETLPDRTVLVDQLEEAAHKNNEVEREILRREKLGDRAQVMKSDLDAIRRRIAGLQADLASGEAEVAKIEAEINGLPALPDKVDVSGLRSQIEQADKIADVVRQIQQRETLEAEYNELVAQSESWTATIEATDKQRNEAIAAAKMPVEGLSLVVDEDDKLGVTFNGIPFSQASSAEQLRVSTAVAMAANPKLRVIRVKDGSLLDKNSLSILREMATENDFQIWGEFVGDEGAGIIMESGKVRGAPEPEPLDRPRRRKVAEEAKPAEEPLVIHRQSAGQIVEPILEGASYTVTDGEDVSVDPVTGEVSRETASKAEPEINKPAPTTLFESMPDAPRRRPRAMSEFRTAPRSANNEESNS